MAKVLIINTFALAGRTVCLLISPRANALGYVLLPLRGVLLLSIISILLLTHPPPSEACLRALASGRAWSFDRHKAKSAEDIFLTLHNCKTIGFFTLHSSLNSGLHHNISARWRIACLAVFVFVPIVDIV